MPHSKSDEATLHLINERIEQVKREITEEELRPLLRTLIREVLREELGADKMTRGLSRQQMEYKR